MLGKTQGAEQRSLQAGPILNQRPHQTAIRIAILTQPFRREVNGAFDHRSPAIIKRMCEWRRRLNPSKTMFGKRQGAKEGRSDGERMYG
jgi:hypothetical protein